MSKITKFDNGLQIVTEEMPQVASVTIGVFVGVGSRDEIQSQRGTSHFLEHLAFKGTKELSAKDLAISVDSFGGDMNAFTTKELTSFQVRLLGEATELGVDILGKILTEPSFNVTDIDSERSVILEEIAMANDEPSDFVHELLAASLYGNHPLGREVLGSRESIIGISRDTICDFFSNYYGPANMVVSAAGALEHDKLVEQFSATLGQISQGVVPVRNQPQLQFSDPVISGRDIEQVHVSIAFPGIPKGDRRRWDMAVLDHIYGGGLSSRLFQKVREETGLCYSIYSDRVSYHDSGYLGVYFATSPAQLGTAAELVDSVTKEFSSAGITEEELAVAKRYLRAQVLLTREDTASVMSQLGSVLVAGQQIKSVEDILSEVERVTVDGVKELADEVFAGSRQISAVGPVPNGVFD
ncbi:MAG: insulinase family protein [Acidimicrobiaceae bacterium]|nr:insulinase family protein [Acidimicrobiaceae bacterium]